MAFYISDSRSEEHAFVIRMGRYEQEFRHLLRPGIMEQDSLIKIEKRVEVHRISERKPQASQWKSPEFFIYYGIILSASFFTIKECIEISSANHPAYASYSHLLSSGWLFNRTIVN